VALANRQMFAEVFDVFFPKVKDKSPEGSRYAIRIQNLNLFPFFRFCQMLGRGEWTVQVPAHMIDVYWCDDEVQQDRALGLRKFSMLKRLVELHWLRGVPIWTCFTEPSAGNFDGGALPDILYSIRQIVALQRSVPAQWRGISTEYVRNCEITEVICVPQTDWQSLTTPDLVETIIETIMMAIEYRMGYVGSFSRVTRDGHVGAYEEEFVDYCIQGEDSEDEKFAFEEEHAAVHIFNLYRKKVDAAPRAELGDEYEAWEKLPDSEKIPQDVVF
jgi:hypothetical protein